MKYPFAINIFLFTPVVAIFLAHKISTVTFILLSLVFILNLSVLRMNREQAEEN